MCGRRMSRHGLTPPLTEGGPAAAAAAMCGTHAQVLSAAEVSIGVRLHSATRTDVQDALWSDHSLVKTFGPRGTVHLLPASDLSLWCGALGALPIRQWARADPAFPDVVQGPPRSRSSRRAVDAGRRGVRRGGASAGCRRRRGRGPAG
ncbi:DNA glycosylase AlkZ-like family protein [Streptomyces xanthophaeus]|uniref:DNA glycosylase AlkZ-like family protein n=1 Tax=Streptomyces xanthophaeus TaxID=67385 RepID=UPI0037170DD5